MKSLRMLPLAALLCAATLTQAQPIKLAFVGPTTGPLTQYGDMVKEGVYTAVERINAAGGVNGRQFVVTEIDDGCEAKQGPIAANRVVNNGIGFVIGHVCSGASIAAADIYDTEGVVMITPAATSPALTDGKNYEFIFRTIGRDDQQGPAAARFIIDKIKPARVAVLHDKQSYGQGIAASVRETLLAAKVAVPYFEGINAGENDYSAVITKLKSMAVDFVYFGGYYPEYGLLLRQSREQGFTAQFMAPEGAVTSDLVAIAGPAIEGALATFPADFTKMPGNETIISAFRAARRDPVGIHQMSAYAAVQILAASINAVGEHPDRVADYMHSHSFDTTIGTVAYDAKGDLKDFVFVVLKFDRDGNTTQL